jgi:hypothetical protein
MSLEDLATAKIKENNENHATYMRHWRIAKGEMRRINRSWPELQGLVGREYHTAYVRLVRAADRANGKPIRY